MRMSDARPSRWCWVLGVTLLVLCTSLVESNAIVVSTVYYKVLTALVWSFRNHSTASIPAAADLVTGVLRKFYTSTAEGRKKSKSSYCPLSPTLAGKWRASHPVTADVDRRSLASGVCGPPA